MEVPSLKVPVTSIVYVPASPLSADTKLKSLPSKPMKSVAAVVALPGNYTCPYSTAVKVGVAQAKGLVVNAG